MNYLQYIPTILVAIFGVIFTIIGFLIKQSIFVAITEMKSKIDYLMAKFSHLESTLPREFLLKQDFENFKKENSDSHAEIWKEIRQLNKEVK